MPLVSPSAAKLDATSPGQREFAVTRLPSSRRASSRVNRTFASFDDAYAAIPSYRRVACRSLKSSPKTIQCNVELTVTTRAGALARSRSSKRVVSAK
jgi:hypothetical protein